MISVLALQSLLQLINGFPCCRNIDEFVSSFFHAHSMVAIISISVSSCKLTTISVHRLLGLRYRQVVTVKPVYVVVTVLRVFPGVGRAIPTMLNPDAAKFVTASGIAVCLMTSTFCDTRIFFKLRWQRTQVHSSQPD